jgi:hypothetical protein
MKKIIVTVYLVFGILQGVIGSTRSTPATRAIFNMSSSFHLYQNINNGKLPGNWPSLIESGCIPPQALADAREYCDIENRYSFVLFPKAFEAWGDEMRILVIANQPGDEGDIQKKPGRFIIVETPEGEIRTRRYTEATLKKIFARNGYDLADYTFDTPSPGKRMPKTSPGLNPPPKTGDSEVPASNAEDLRVLQKTAEPKRPSAFPHLWMVGVAIFLASVMGYVICQRRSKSL